MSYTTQRRRAAHLGHLSGINDKVDRGDEVTLRFQPGAGVNASTGQRVIDALRTGVLGTRHFETPSVASWGAGTNRGMLVIKAETKSDNYTLQQIANFMPNIARNASAGSRLPVTFASASNEDGDEAFAQSPGGGSTDASGVTSAQLAQLSLLNRITVQNSVDVATLFGPAAPEFSFKKILDFDFGAIARESAPGQMLRSLLVYSVAQNTRALLKLPALMRAQNEGSREAAGLVEKITNDVRSSNDNIALVVAKFKQYVPQAQGTSGLGEPITLTVLGVTLTITAAQVIAVIAAALGAILLVHWYLKNMTTNVERTEEFCRTRERVTGVPCTAEDFAEHARQLPPDATQMLSRAGDKIIEGVGTATTVLLVGGAVALVAYFGWQAFAARGGMARLSAKASSVRDRVRARFGGGASSAPRLSSSSESFEP